MVDLLFGQTSSVLRKLATAFKPTAPWCLTSTLQNGECSRPRRKKFFARPKTYSRMFSPFKALTPKRRQFSGQLLNEESVSYVSRSEAEVRNDAKQFVTYVMVQCGQRLLFFKRSYLSRAAEFLRGSKCIGFGGHVSAAGCEIFYHWTTADYRRVHVGNSWKNCI